MSGGTGSRPSTPTSPRVVRAPLKEMTFMGGKFAPVMGAEGDDGPVGDWWNPTRTCTGR
ncbi:hypothetical protein SMICM304S_11080 [Streptomyces microflavus]